MILSVQSRKISIFRTTEDNCANYDALTIHLGLAAMLRGSYFGRRKRRIEVDKNRLTSKTCPEGLHRIATEMYNGS